MIFIYTYLIVLNIYALWILCSLKLAELSYYTSHIHLYHPSINIISDTTFIWIFNLQINIIYYCHFIENVYNICFTLIKLRLMPIIICFIIKLYIIQRIHIYMLKLYKYNICIIVLINELIRQVYFHKVVGLFGSLV